MNNLGSDESRAQPALYERLEKVINGASVSMRECNTLREPLVSALSEWLEKADVKLYYAHIAPDMLSALCMRGEVSAKKLKNYAGGGGDENRVNVLVRTNQPIDSGLADKMDVIISVDSLTKRASFCFPSDIFDYDRLYLSGKLRSLSGSRKNVSIALGGSSYAMVGLKEDLMPRPAVNLAVNAQDPYYAFLSIEQAKNACRRINTVVIAGGYYFWHTDMSDDPSDYYRSVLTRVNYPVFHDFHHYRSEPADPMKRAQFDPLLEKLFDLQHLCEKRNADISTRLASLSYFNDEINKRPVNGMLNFSFREQPDAVNDRAAEARAKGHNGNFNLKRLEANDGIFRQFLARMSGEQVRVIVLVPPVTKFYKQHIAPELKETTLEHLQAVREDFDFIFLDLTESSDYDVDDFQDYDHLSDKGARRLSSYVAGLIENNRSGADA